MNANLTDDQAKQIGAQLEAGQKIGAIKLYREFTGCDLKTAKDSVEALIAGLLQREPVKYAKLNQSQGCSVRVAALLVFGVIGVVILFRFLKSVPPN